MERLVRSTRFPLLFLMLNYTRSSTIMLLAKLFPAFGNADDHIGIRKEITTPLGNFHKRRIEK
jgi:hypothetical protein